LKAYCCSICSTAAFIATSSIRFFGSATAALPCVQSQIRHQLAKPRALIPQLLGFLRLAHVHPTVLRLPGIDGVLPHPHSRATSSTFRPASTCFSAAIICASVCLLFDILRPFQIRFHIRLCAEFGEQVSTSCCSLVERALTDYKALRVGSKRKDVEQHFDESGGLSFLTNQADCPSGHRLSLSTRNATS